PGTWRTETSIGSIIAYIILIPGGFRHCLRSDNVFVDTPFAGDPLQNFICCPGKVACDLLPQPVCLGVQTHRCVPRSEVCNLLDRWYSVICSVVTRSRLKGRISDTGSAFTFAGQWRH